jgi:hypothetical protein
MMALNTELEKEPPGTDRDLHIVWLKFEDRLPWGNLKTSSQKKEQKTHLSEKRDDSG